MADEEEMIASDVPSEGDEDETLEPPTAKRSKVSWQETLIILLEKQQEQIKQLTHQSKMAPSPVPTPSAVSRDELSAQASVGNAHASFKLTSFDPDKSAYSMEEWLDDATKLKEELKISDNLMIAKASEALKNRGYKYCCDWRPLNRSWEHFRVDLSIAFPDQETSGARAYKAATLRSHTCDSLCEYGNQKLRDISRFQDNLPWHKILSMVEFGLDHAEARSALRVQKPDSERELLKLLAEFDARRVESPNMSRRTEAGALPQRWKFDRSQKERRENRGVRPGSSSQTVCFKCGLLGHRQNVCRSSQKEAPLKETKADIPSCTHCKKLGHTEVNCWYKHGKPKKAFMIRK